MSVRERDQLGDRVLLGNRIGVRDDDVLPGRDGNAGVDVRGEASRPLVPHNTVACRNVAVDAARPVGHDHELVDLRLQGRRGALHQPGFLGSGDDHDPGDLHAASASR